MGGHKGTAGNRGCMAGRVAWLARCATILLAMQFRRGLPPIRMRPVCDARCHSILVIRFNVLSVPEMNVLKHAGSWSHAQRSMSVLLAQQTGHCAQQTAAPVRRRMLTSDAYNTSLLWSRSWSVNASRQSGRRSVQNLHRCEAAPTLAPDAYNMRHNEQLHSTRNGCCAQLAQSQPPKCLFRQCCRRQRL